MLWQAVLVVGAQPAVGTGLFPRTGSGGRDVLEWGALWSGHPAALHPDCWTLKTPHKTQFNSRCTLELEKPEK